MKELLTLLIIKTVHIVLEEEKRFQADPFTAPTPKVCGLVGTVRLNKDMN